MSQPVFSPYTLQVLREYTSAEALQQGLELHSQRAAMLTGHMNVEEGIAYDFFVRDEPGKPGMVETGVYLEPGAGLDSECTCLNLPCAHEVAAILYLLDKGWARFEADGDVPRETVPAWRKTLDSVLPPVAEADEVTNDVCLFFSAESGSLRIRPGQRGKTGWIKGKAKWDALYNLRCGANVLRLLKELYNTWLGSPNRYRYGWGYGYQGDWLPLDALGLPQLWDIFIELREAGVVFIAWDGRRPVELSAEPARLRIAARREGKEGDLELLPELCFGDTPMSTIPDSILIFLGKPATVLAEVRQTSASSQDIRLRPFAEPTRDELLRLFGSQETLRVEAEDREDFENHYLPRLQQMVPVESPDNSYQPPAPRPSVLKLEATPVTGEDDELLRLHLQWSWDRGPLGKVDREHEAAVENAVENAVGSASDQTLPRDRAVPFLAETLPRLQTLDHVHVTVTDEVPEFRPATHSPQVTVGLSVGEHDWFDLQVEVTAGGEKVSFAELFTALSRNEEIFVLPSGTYFNLDTPEFDQLRRIIEEAKTLNDTTVQNLKVSRYQVDLWEELVETGIVDAQEHDWWDRIHALIAASEQNATDALIEVPESVNAELRDYQKSGYRWLETLRRNDLGGVLADDMGLGKTLQVIAMIATAFEENPDGPPFLVVAPTSVVGNWVREIKKFAPELSTLMITETEKKRGLSLVDMVTGDWKMQVVVTSYTLFRLEFDDYAGLDWAAAVFDEAQMIKNHASKAYKNARLLDVPVKIAVTGTPMENNLLELWALMSLTSPGLLGGKMHFTEFYRTPIEKDNDLERLELLQRRMRPFLLRRTKELVASDLPEKVENVMEVDLYPKHRRLYDRRLQRERQKVLGLVDDLNANRFEVFRSLTLLRQLALDAELAAEGAAPSAKLDALADLLSSAATEGHRVLVLSQFTRFLAKARDVATAVGIDSLYLDGKTRDRHTLIDEFRDGQVPVFFISLKAGGFGLNLTEADYVVLLDPWWNPATEAQAVDRAHRIGQTRQVIVYRLVARDTIESKVMDLKKSKAALFDRVLEGGGIVEADGLGVEDIRALME